jgi:hypothetical protein
MRYVLLLFVWTVCGKLGCLGLFAQEFSSGLVDSDMQELWVDSIAFFQLNDTTFVEMRGIPQQIPAIAFTSALFMADSNLFHCEGRVLDSMESLCVQSIYIGNIQTRRGRIVDDGTEIPIYVVANATYFKLVDSAFDVQRRIVPRDVLVFVGENCMPMMYAIGRLVE